MQKSNSKQEVEAQQQIKPMPASEEIVKMLSHAPDILKFKPSEKARNRVWELIAREKDGTLTEDEKTELEHYAQIEHLMRLVKAQARKRLVKAS